MGHWRDVTRPIETAIARHVQADRVHWRKTWGAAKVEPNSPRNCLGVQLGSVLQVGAGLLQVCLAAARILRELLGVPRRTARMRWGASGATGAATAL